MQIEGGVDGSAIVGHVAEINRLPDAVVMVRLLRSALALPAMRSFTVPRQVRRNVDGPSTVTGHAVSAVVVAYICCTQ